MKSTTSCFNKTMFQKDIKQFWPVMAAAVVAALFVFRYLNVQCSAFALHSLPLRRETLFVSHFLSGFVLLLVPGLVLGLELAAVSAGYGLHLGRMVLSFVLEVFVMMLFFYSMAVMLAMMSGNTVISLLMYVVLNVLVYGFHELFYGYMDNFIYGGMDYSTYLSGWLSDALTPVFRFTGLLYRQEPVPDVSSPDALVTANGVAVNAFQWQTVCQFAVYLIPAVFFILAGLVLYRCRKLERVGDMLVFSFTKVVYRAVFCACGSLLVSIGLLEVVRTLFGTRLTYGRYYAAGLAILAAGVGFCHLVCSMILEKTVRIRRKVSLPELGIFIVVMLALFAGGKRQAEKKWLVDAAQVESMEISLGVNTFTLKNPEKIREFVAVENQIVENAKNRAVVSGYESIGVAVKYSMREEPGIVRYYDMDANADRSDLRILAALLNEKEIIKGGLIPENVGYADVQEMGYLDVETGDEEDRVWEYDIKSQALYDAVMQDLEEGTLFASDGFDGGLGSILAGENEAGILSFSYEYEEALDEKKKYLAYKQVQLVVTKDAERTLEALENVDELSL